MLHNDRWIPTTIGHLVTYKHFFSMRFVVDIDTNICLSFSSVELKKYNVNLHYNKYMQQLYKFISTNIILISRVFKNPYSGTFTLEMTRSCLNSWHIMRQIRYTYKHYMNKLFNQKLYIHHWHINKILPIIRPHVHKIAQSTRRLKMIGSNIPVLCQYVACTHDSHARGKHGKINQQMV